MTTRMEACTRVLLQSFLATLLIFKVAAAQTIPVISLSQAPSVDGSGEEWPADNTTIVQLKNIKPTSHITTTEVAVSAGVFQDTVYFYFAWEDATLDDKHKPWEWNTEKDKYVRGAAREDRIAIQFEISGDYTTDWFSGNEFEADMWHWKASRSNPLNLVHDKSTKISKNTLLRSYTTTNESGDTIYIARPSDQGSKLYTAKRYHRYQGDTVPKYEQNNEVTGSVADVKATGVWREGKWHIELSRALVTGHSDDAAFKLGQTVKGGLAIFDHTENDDHAISETLLFKF